MRKQYTTTCENLTRNLIKGGQHNKGRSTTKITKGKKTDVWKQYRQSDKQKINDGRWEKIKCECGSMIRRVQLARHKKTKTGCKWNLNRLPNTIQHWRFASPQFFIIETSVCMIMEMSETTQYGMDNSVWSALLISTTDQYYCRCVLTVILNFLETQPNPFQYHRFSGRRPQVVGLT